MSTVFNNGQRLLDNNMKEAISYKCTCMAKLRISIRFRLIVWLQLQNYCSTSSYCADFLCFY